MATVTIGSGGGGFVAPFVAPLIERAADWSRDWAVDPELELVSCQDSCSRAATCLVRRRYGQVKAPYETGFPQNSRAPVDYRGQWIRVSYAGAAGSAADSAGNAPAAQVLFQGQIDSQANFMFGGTDPSALGGIQEWTASGGMRILEKITLSQAIFAGAAGAAQKVGWLPHVNLRDEDGVLVGNRSPAKAGDNDSYLYDGGPGAQNWTHLQYLIYLVANFINQGSGVGDESVPFWSVGGQTDILDAMTTSVRFAEALSVLEAIKLLAPVKYGIDFLVKPTDAGFEINIFALGSNPQTIAGVTMPSNPRQTQVVRGGQIDFFEAQVVESDVRRVDSIRIIGKRIVVCGTLRASDQTLVRKWTDTQEAAYKSAAGHIGDANADGESNDRIRRSDENINKVFEIYGAPVGWDKQRWRITCDFNGNLVEDGANNQDAPPFQSVIRRTLAKLPLQENVDYSQNPPLNNNLAGNEPEFKSPLVWLTDTMPKDGLGDCLVLAHGEGLHVSVASMDWGVRLEASINHLLAVGDWSDSDADTSDIEPRFDTSTLAATIAIEADARLQLGYDVPPELAAGDGSVMTILDEQAEMWVVLAGTQVDVVPVTDPESSETPPDAQIVSVPVTAVLRSDKDRLALALAGAMGRYINERIKARFVFKGHLPWLGLLGSILTVYQQGGVQTRIGAAITGIQWTSGTSPETIVTTGYA